MWLQCENEMDFVSGFWDIIKELEIQRDTAVADPEGARGPGGPGPPYPHFWGPRLYSGAQIMHFSGGSELAPPWPNPGSVTVQSHSFLFVQGNVVVYFMSDHRTLFCVIRPGVHYSSKELEHFFWHGTEDKEKTHLVL